MNKRYYFGSRSNKIKGEHYRYICEFSEGEELDEESFTALKIYEEAINKSQNLPNSNKVRLDLCLNFSKFLYEQMNL